ncbi:MAG: cytochrome-c peroxidase [Cytophagales bacterium]|nr:cytochrome-c peroxidase [Cytophagales bacterium]
MKNSQFVLILITVGLFLLVNCKEDSPTIEDHPTPYELVIPEGFPEMTVPDDNPMTVEGISLGRMLFYDPILSGDSTQSCATCHAQAFAFSDNGNQFSEGIDGEVGDRNSTAIINPGWLPSLFWDGRASSVEDQAFGPVPNPIEMHEEWTEATDKLNAHADYPDLFLKAFETDDIDSVLVVKAIAQFERTLISSNSKFDRYLARTEELTESEQNGLDLFFSEVGDCFHCHGTILFTDNLFHNNGLDRTFTDLGLGGVTDDSNDDGKFKAPTLRNIAFTAPYMHDGRFNTLEEVIDFYSEGLQSSPTIDPLLTGVLHGGRNLSNLEKEDLISFLLTLSDSTFIANPDFSNPF